MYGTNTDLVLLFQQMTPGSNIDQNLPPYKSSAKKPTSLDIFARNACGRHGSRSGSHQRQEATACDP